LAQESPNDRNDRAIRRATAWYNDRLGQGRVLMLSNDRGNVQNALVEKSQRKLCGDSSQKFASTTRSSST
jgi:hypothetical protein